MRNEEGQIRGNRLALLGAIVYFLEWVVIIPTGTPDPAEHLRTSPQRLVALYAEHSNGIALLAGWLALVLVGRLAFAAGLRGAFPRSSRALPLLDLAFGAMILSVVLEVSGQGMAGAAGTLAARGSDPGAVVALNSAAAWLTQLLFVPLGLFVLAAAAAMLTSRLFPWWLGWLGLIGGLALGPGGVVGVATFAPSSGDSIGLAPVGLGVPMFWLWMLATGVLLFRRARRSDVATSERA